MFGFIVNNCVRAEQESSMLSQSNQQSEELPACLKPEQLLDQAHIVEVFETCKKTIINHKLQIYKALIYCKLLVEKANESIDASETVHKKAVDAQIALQKFVQHIQLFDDAFRPQLQVHLKNVIIACTILCHLENKSDAVDQEDIEFLLRMIEKLEKEKVLIAGFTAAVEDKQKTLKGLIDDVHKAVVIE